MCIGILCICPHADISCYLYNIHGDLFFCNVTMLHWFFSTHCSSLWKAEITVCVIHCELELRFRKHSLCVVRVRALHVLYYRIHAVPNRGRDRTILVSRLDRHNEKPSRGATNTPTREETLNTILALINLIMAKWHGRCVHWNVAHENGALPTCAPCRVSRVVPDSAVMRHLQSRCHN